MYVCMHAGIYVRMYVCTYICMYVCMSVIIIWFLQHCYISMLSLLLEHLLFHPCRSGYSANLPALEGLGWKAWRAGRLEGWKNGRLVSQRSLEADLSHEKGTLLKAGRLDAGLSRKVASP